MKTYNNLVELLEDQGDETPFLFGRSLYKYTSCGPWTVFLTPEKEYYYEDATCRAESADWRALCTGIRIGSIVEGSDVEVGPEVLEFPFTSDDLASAIERIAKEASFYWERDNTRWFALYHEGVGVGFASWTEFDDAPKFETDSPLPDEVRQAFEKWYADRSVLDYADRSVLDYDTKHPFAPGWECQEFINDSTF